MACVIIWLNGTFGAGKTTTCAHLERLVPGAHVFDTEQVGVMLPWLRAAGTVVDTTAAPPREVARRIAELTRP